MTGMTTEWHDPTADIFEREQANAEEAAKAEEAAAKEAEKEAKAAAKKAES